MKKANLLRSPHSSSLRRTSMYAYSLEFRVPCILTFLIQPAHWLHEMMQGFGILRRSFLALSSALYAL